jgi:hypothetical protein
MSIRFIVPSILLIFMTYFSIHHIVRCQIYKRKVIALQKKIFEEDEKYRAIVSDLLKADDLEQLETYAIASGFRNVQKKDCVFIDPLT